MPISRRKLILAFSGVAATAAFAACAAPTPTASPPKPTEAPKPAATTAPAPAKPTEVPKPTAAAPATTAPAVKPTEAPAPTKPTEAPKPAAAAPAAGSAGQKVLYWGSFGGNLGKAEQETVTRFNAQSKGTQVEYQFQGSYEETAGKLAAALAAKQGLPDVTLLSDVWWQKFWLNATITPVDSYIGTAKADYVDSFVEEGTRQGKMWWVPFARSTPMLYYNKDHFKAGGLPDKAPESWTEFLEWAPKLVKREGSELKQAAFGMPLGASYNAWVFQPVIWQFGGRYSNEKYEITVAEPKAIEAGQHYADLVSKYKVASVPKDHQVDFQNGLISMIFASTAGLAGIETNSKFPVGTGFLPKGPAGFGCCTGGSGLALLASSPEEKRAAGFEFVSFATSPDHTAWWSQNTGYMPVRKSALESLAMNAFYKEKPNFQTAVKQLPLTKPQDWARVGIGNGDQIIGKALERITVANEPVQPVFNELKLQLEKEGKAVKEQLQKIGAL